MAYPIPILGSIAVTHTSVCFLANPVWGPFLCYHDKITILDILLANFWWSQQLLDHESYSFLLSLPLSFFWSSTVSLLFCFCSSVSLFAPVCLFICLSLSLFLSPSSSLSFPSSSLPPLSLSLSSSLSFPSSSLVPLVLSLALSSFSHSPAL